MKGIILAGGTGSRLWPITHATNKQLLPVWDKPMIFYPLSTLMLAGIRDILIITTTGQTSAFMSLLGDGSQFGVRLSYAEQDKPNGIAEALLIGRDFLDGSSCALILGDNLFHGDNLGARLQAATRRHDGATVFVHAVRDPERYGVMAFDGDGNPLDIIEKPSHPPSNLAVTGLYFFDGTAPERASALLPSHRGELEITDLNRAYLEDGMLNVEMLGRGCAWLDTGTPASLLQAAQFVCSVEERQGLKIGSPEETAWRLGWIARDEMTRSAGFNANSEYGRYLDDMARANDRNAIGVEVDGLGAFGFVTAREKQAFYSSSHNRRAGHE
ncbi:glucose-1-phosphate thymidylyltransferase RfbA [Thalassospira marina]|uniref:Glucose-1-phosphate thymidylyltransferase n=1 Tax=Thalassospira marina TaxID=2048283 RepID=A0ABM6Q8C2_9PROT|nr:glucose-1-phosphate thymidylyltransferase RfbA [Thalassospira marina]AUG52711.1 glucose-1-phosphate thymidylyltransferase [Thalassospira marina]